MEKELNFEEFTPSRSVNDEESISITKNGAFTFLSVFYRNKKIDQFGYVIISYDSKNKAVGFSFTNNKEKKGTLKLDHRKNNSAAIVSNSFWRVFKLNPETYKGKYSPHFLSQNEREIHYILLNEKT